MSITHKLPKAFISWLESRDPAMKIWLVGGAVRDFFLGRATVDFDFVTTVDASDLARSAADGLNGDVYILDRERGTARVLLDKDSSARQVLDFAALRGPTIEADLKARDFTINSMAVDLEEPEELIDPCSGLADVRSGVVRACTEASIEHDPIRALRAMRLAGELGFALEPHTRELLHSAAGTLAGASRERIRDEVFRMLAVDEPAVPFYLLRHFDFEKTVFGVEMGEANAQLALSTWRELSGIFSVLAPEFDPESAASASLGLLVWQLGRYRSNLWTYFQEEITPFRRRRELCYLGARAWLASGDAGESTRAIGDLRLSQAEIKWLGNFNHGLAALAELESDPVGIYRFFRLSTDAGVACGLVYLAQILAREGSGLQAQGWAQQVGNVRAVLEAYFERRSSLIDPEPVLTGDDLMRELNVPPGPRIGTILEQLREQQVAGRVVNRAQALVEAREIDARLRRETS